MRLHNLKCLRKLKSSHRIGRGIAAGKGKTCGRGTKGQKSRSGYNIPKRFEGGQTSLIQKLPKRKLSKSRKNKYLSLSLRTIRDKFQKDETICAKTLKAKGLINNLSQRVKIIGYIKDFQPIIKGCRMSNSVYNMTSQNNQSKNSGKV